MFNECPPNYLTEEDEIMATAIKPELSDKNKYWIEKHRYYELKHFCLQYPIWKKAHHALDGFSSSASDILIGTKTQAMESPTMRVGEARAHYQDRMDMVEKAAQQTESLLSQYILLAVTTGLSFTNLKTMYEIPCGRDYYYTLYRRFFWNLNKLRE